MTKAEMVNGLFKKYNLTKEDFFKHKQGWVIITRTGIDKIQAGANINISYEVLRMERDWVILKAVGNMGDDKIETFGSAEVGGFGKGTTQSKYVVEIAEKRAMSRAVLKLAGFYQLGVFSEDESEDFKRKGNEA